MNGKLQTIALLHDLHIITGARISLHDLDFNEIAAFPNNLSPFCEYVQNIGGVREKCVKADKSAFEKVMKSGEVYSYKCHCGLTEIVAPIFHYGDMSGYLMLGQIANNGDLDMIKNTVSHIAKSKDIPFSEIPFLDPIVLSSCINVSTAVASYLTQSNVIEPISRDLAENVCHYINVHYSEPITINLLCSLFFCSRTTLMNLFKKKYNVTVFEYLNKYRLAKAEKMLVSSNKSIRSVAAECGFCDPNYFSKVFYKLYGMTPTDYRKK